MNLIKKKSTYEGHDTCPICLESFVEKDHILLIRHSVKLGQAEKTKITQQRKHIFHEACIQLYLDSIHSTDLVCPLDREPIFSLIEVKYYAVVSPNIAEFESYYQLLDKFDQKDINCVSITDNININCKDLNGKTLIYCACQRGNLKLLHRLVQLGGDPSISDENGFTPLMAAVSHNYIGIVKYLLKLQIIRRTINYTNRHGKTAIEYTHELSHLQCLTEFLTIEGLDHIILLKLLNQYQSVKDNPMANIIKKAIKKYLKMNITTVAPHILLTRSVPTRVLEKSSVFNLDIDRNPELFRLLYQPNGGSQPQRESQPQTQGGPQGPQRGSQRGPQGEPQGYNDDEITCLSNFSQINENLIYE